MTTTHATSSLSIPPDHADRRPTWQVVTGRVLTGLVATFLAVDSATKLARESHAVAFAEQIGAPGWFTPLCGAVLAACLVAHLVPRTAALGAVLLTGYLGGAVATQLVTGQPLGNAAFALGTGVVVWAGLWPRDARVRSLFR